MMTKRIIQPLSVLIIVVLWSFCAGKTDDKAKAGNEIHVYDWKGTPKKRFILDKDCRVICASPEDNFILAAGFNESENLLKYQIAH